MASSPSDIELMLQFQQGDEDAFTALVRRHQRSVLNLVRRFVGPVAEMEDLAQEIFVRLYQARAGYRPSAKFTTFLYRNTLNLCLNFLRDRKHRRTLSLERPGEDGEERMEPPDSRAVDPHAALSDREVAATVRRAVAALPDNQRAAILLLQWHGLPYQEIAETMNLSVMAVKSLLSRARENLKTSLAVLLKDEDVVRRAREGAGDGGSEP